MLMSGEAESSALLTRIRTCAYQDILSNVRLLRGLRRIDVLQTAADHEASACIQAGEMIYLAGRGAGASGSACSEPISGVAPAAMSKSA